MIPVVVADEHRVQARERRLSFEERALQLLRQEPVGSEVVPKERIEGDPGLAGHDEHSFVREIVRPRLGFGSGRGVSSRPASRRRQDRGRRDPGHRETSFHRFTLLLRAPGESYCDPTDPFERTGRLASRPRFL
jgi:hypothetical protein